MGGKGQGGACRGSPPPYPGQGGPWRPARFFFFSGAPPLGIYLQPGLPRSPGRQARSGRSSVGQPGGGGGGLPVRRTPGGSLGGPRGVGGGEATLPRSVSPPSPGGHQGGLIRLRPTLHAAFLGAAVPLRPVGRPGAPGAELLAGSGHCGSEWAADWGHLARGCGRCGCGSPPPGCRGPLGGGCGAAASLAGVRLSAGRRGGRRGGVRRGSPQSPPGPLASPPSGCGGGGLVVPVPGGQPPTGGARSSPAPLHPSGPRSGPLLSSLSPRSAGWPGGGGGRRVLRAAVRVSGSWVAACGAMGLPPRSLPPPSPLLEAVRVSPPRRTVGGGGGRAPGPEARPC